MNKQFIIIILKRFAKAFLAGGCASLTVQLAMTPSIVDFNSLKPWLLSLAVAFISGGLMAIEKATQGFNPQ